MESRRESYNPVMIRYKIMKLKREMEDLMKEMQNIPEFGIHEILLKDTLLKLDNLEALKALPHVEPRKSFFTAWL